jgi:hypothetical protein
MLVTRAACLRAAAARAACCGPVCVCVCVCVCAHAPLAPQLRLNASHSKNKLYFGNLPRSYTQLQVETHFNKASKGARGVEPRLLVCCRRGPCPVAPYTPTPAS